MTLILFILCAILIFGVMILMSVAKGVASIFCKPSSSSGSGFGNNRTSNNNNTYNSSNTTKKVFSKDEGEYVSYEEVKD